MSQWSLDTPVAFFIFNRPEKTERVFERIAEIQPPEFLIVADGPRPDQPDDQALCEETRAVVDEGVDWDCRVLRNYADENLGIRKRFSTGLEWVFDEVSESIILEDDCVPNQSFFRFCDTMLDRYRGDERVMDVTGQNVVGDWHSDRQDYLFSHFGGVWGWATWRRAWELYDPEMTLWDNPLVRDRLRDVIADRRLYGYLKHIYQRTYEGEIETWDYQWRFARNINSALTVVPAKNLVTNIGFDGAATHTTSIRSPLAGQEPHELKFPVDHPEFVAVDRGYDREFFKLRPITQRFRPLRLLRSLYFAAHRSTSR